VHVGGASAVLVDRYPAGKASRVGICGRTGRTNTRSGSLLRVGRLESLAAFPRCHRLVVASGIAVVRAGFSPVIAADPPPNWAGQPYRWRPKDTFEDNRAAAVESFLHRLASPAAVGRQAVAAVGLSQVETVYA
jgi:hypothetical protein